MSERSTARFEFVDRLVAAAKLLRIYGADHARGAEALEACRVATEALREESVAQGDVIRIALRGVRVFLENLPLPLESVGAQSMTEFLDPNQGRAAVAIDLRYLATNPAPVLVALDGRGSSKAIAWLTPYELELLDRDPSSAIGRPASSDHLLFRMPEFVVRREDYRAAVDGLEEFMASCREAGRADLDSTLALANDLVARIVEDSAGILPMTTVPYYDRYTYYHSINVCLLTLNAARLVVDDSDLLMRIGRAALLHDIGKARVPEEILYKPGKLTDEEFEVIKSHPLTGAKMLQDLEPVDPMVVAVAFGHHVLDGGKGYPAVGTNYRRGPVTALVQVADIFEALTARRPYKQPLTAYQAFEILYSMHGIRSLRPTIDLLYRSIGRTPLGSRVRTREGDIGVVRGHDAGDVRRPVLQIVQPWDQCPDRPRGDSRVVADETDIESLSPIEDVEFCN